MFSHSSSSFMGQSPSHMSSSDLPSVIGATTVSKSDPSIPSTPRLVDSEIQSSLEEVRRALEFDDSVCAHRYFGGMGCRQLGDEFHIVIKANNKGVKDPSISSADINGGEDSFDRLLRHCNLSMFTIELRSAQAWCADVHSQIKDIRSDIGDPQNEQSSARCIRHEKEKCGLAKILLDRSTDHFQWKVAEVVLGITGQAAFSLLGYYLTSSSNSSNQSCSSSLSALTFIVAANAIGFIGTLTAILLRRRKRVVPGLARKIVAIAASSGIIVAMGMFLPEKFMWTSGIACLIPATVVVFA